MDNLVWKMIKKEDVNSLPNGFGVFVISFQDSDRQNDYIAIYIGSSKNLHKSVVTLLKDGRSNIRLKQFLSNHIIKISYVCTPDFESAEKIKEYMDRYYNPIYSKKKIINSESDIISFKRPNVKKI